MPDTVETTHAFISYAHQDTIIAEEIERQLTILAGKGKGRYFFEVLSRHKEHSARANDTSR